jgi:uncharacterized protein with NRDE domain
MCLVALAIDQDRRFPLVIAANRDEFFKRPAARLAWWTPQHGEPAILAGRDLEGGGTWMGVTGQGRLALLTNRRDPSRIDPDAPSRGQIVPNWLSAREPIDRFWMRTALSGYNGFNLIAADFRLGECFWASNLEAHPKRLERGLYGLSNAALDTPWPKVQALKAALGASISSASTVDELAGLLFAALADRSTAEDKLLPRTGIPLDLERALSSAFIRTPDQAYGTRCSTLIITERAQRHLVTHVFERSFSPTGGLALLRRASLRHWPPRYTSLTAPADAELGVVSESEMHDGTVAKAPLRRTRVRSLLKPAAPRRTRVTSE